MSLVISHYYFLMNFFGKLKNAAVSAGNKFKKEIDDLIQENNQLQTEENKLEKSIYYNSKF